MKTLVAPDSLARSARLLDARSGPGARARYEADHLSGALFIDLETDLSEKGDPAIGGRHPLPPIETFARTLGRLGIGPETSVVVYDDQGGANAAARAWWMLRAVGHREVAVLDGGLAAALAAGHSTDAEIPVVGALAPYPVTAWKLPAIGIDEVARIARDPSHLLIDVRAPERYRGDSEPIDPVAGHIPGALNVPLARNLGSDGRFKSQEELRALYDRERGDVPPERIVVSCGSGVTACHTLLALEHAGLPGAALYVGSFGEWCRTGRPLAGPKR